MVNRIDGLPAFHQHETQNAKVPLPDGPFAKLIRTISRMQGDVPETSPFRIGLITARNAPAHERAIRTLREWSVRLDCGAFLGGLPKEPWLKAFSPQIFFDDQESYCTAASPLVPTAQVPYPVCREVTLDKPIGVVQREESTRKDQFLLLCRGYLKNQHGQAVDVLTQWYTNYLENSDEQTFQALTRELSQSIELTPVGHERPSKGKNNGNAPKFLTFLDTLLRKHRLSNSKFENGEVD